jgi:hypothetical protein
MEIGHHAPNRIIRERLSSIIATRDSFAQSLN